MDPGATPSGPRRLETLVSALGWARPRDPSRGAASRRTRREHQPAVGRVHGRRRRWPEFQYTEAMHHAHDTTGRKSRRCKLPHPRTGLRYEEWRLGRVHARARTGGRVRGFTSIRAEQAEQARRTSSTDDDGDTRPFSRSRQPNRIDHDAASTYSSGCFRVPGEPGRLCDTVRNTRAGPCSRSRR